MPPKRKQASAAYSTCLAKKRKRNERQRDQQCSELCAISESLSTEERRHERDAEAHRLVQMNPTRRQQEQKRDTAARRQIRAEHTERRSQEQVCFPTLVLRSSVDVFCCLITAT